MTPTRMLTILLLAIAVFLGYRALQVHEEKARPKIVHAAPVAKPLTPEQSERLRTQHVGRKVPRKEKVVVAFRLDRTLTHGIYLGDRWVSPARYNFAQPNDYYVVQSKMMHVDERGERKDMTAQFKASDPEMIDLMAGEKPGEWTLIVMKPGESKVTASSGAQSKVLNVRAWEVGKGMQVEITQ